MSTTTKLLTTVAVVAAAYVGASWYVGKKAETEIHHQVSELNAAIQNQYQANLGGAEVELKVLNYNRGWLSSEISYELLVKPPQDEALALLFLDQMAHGPLPMAALLKGQFKPMLAYSNAKLIANENVQPWFDMAHGKDPLVARSVIAFSGAVDSKIKLAALDYQDEDGNKVHMKPANLDIDYQKKTDHLAIASYFPDVTFFSAPEAVSIQLKESRLVGEASNVSQADAQSSNAQLTVKNVQFESPGKFTAQIDNLQSSSNYLMQEGLVDSSVHYAFDKASLDGHELGKMDFEVEFNRLNYAVLNQLSQIEQLDADNEEQLLALAKELLSTKPEFHINNISWTNSAGKSQLKALVRAAATGADQANEPKLGHYVEALEVDVQLSRKMLLGFFKEENFISSLADMMFGRFAEQGVEAGLLSYDGETAQLKLHFDAAEQKLLLNNKAITEEELLYILMILQSNGGLL